ncbi:MAG: sulfatase [Candidatus Nanohaloarchaea archaeon]
MERLGIVLMLLITGLTVTGISVYNGGKAGGIKDAGYHCTGCNIVMVSVDLTRPDHMSAYGYPKNTTPNIERFSRNTTVFTNAYSQSPFTMESLISSFTSLYPLQHRVNTLNAPKRGFSDDFMMFPEVLRKKGYATYGIYDPSDVRPEYGLGRGFITYRSQEGFSNDTDMISAYINRSGDRSFFIYDQVFTLHTPNFPPPEYLDNFTEADWKFRNRSMEYWNSLSDLESNNKRYRKWQSFYYGNIEDNKTLDRYLSKSYDGELRYVDSKIGKVFTLLKRRKMLNDTIVVVTANHATQLGEHRAYGEGGLRKAGLNVPLMIYLPHKEQSGDRIDNFVASIDIAPTLLDIIGVHDPEYSRQAEGVSLLPLISGNRDKLSKDYIISEKFNGQKTFIDKKTGLKLNTFRSGKIRGIHNVTADPEEKNGLTNRTYWRYMHDRFKNVYERITGRDPFDTVEVNTTFPYYVK